MALINLTDILDSLHSSSAKRGPTPKPGQTSSFSFLSLVAQWEQVVGKKWIHKTRPLKISHKQLIVITTHPTYAHQLQFMEEVLRKKIFKLFPVLRPHINRIRTQYNPSAFQKQAPLQDNGQTLVTQEDKPPAANTNAPHPYNPRYRALLKEGEEKFAEVANDSLRHALTEFYVKCKFYQPAEET